MIIKFMNEALKTTSALYWLACSPRVTVDRGFESRSSQTKDQNSYLLLLH
jgi:hypothetical protein